MNVKKPLHKPAKNYSDYLEEAEKKDPSTYEGYREVVLKPSGKLKEYLRYLFHFNSKT